MPIMAKFTSGTVRGGMLSRSGIMQHSRDLPGQKLVLCQAPNRLANHGGSALKNSKKRSNENGD
jgi:hypothetical protein